MTNKCRDKRCYEYYYITEGNIKSFISLIFSKKLKSPHRLKIEQNDNECKITSYHFHVNNSNHVTGLQFFHFKFNNFYVYEEEGVWREYTNKDFNNKYERVIKHE